jgi:RNA polymerase sigma factor (sigma-70 family)
MGAVYDLEDEERAEGAFEVLRARHEGRVLDVLRRAGCPQGQLDDIAQDTFVRVWLTRETTQGRFDPAEGEFGAWIVVIARNRLAEVQRRAEHRRRRPMPEEEVATDLDPSADMQRADFTRCVEEWEQGLGEGTGSSGGCCEPANLRN